MKINNYGENFIIKKIQKKIKTVLHSDSLCTISQINKGWFEGMVWVELPICRKIFYCDQYQIKGKTIIASALEDNYVSIINMETGDITKAQRVEFENNFTIVTLQGGQRRFIDNEGNIQEAEIGSGGIFHQNYNKYNSVFVDENGNTAAMDKTFVDYYDRVRAGVLCDSSAGVYSAVNVHDDREVKYSFTGKELKNSEEYATYGRLHAFYQKKLKLSQLPDKDLIDKDVFNFILDEVRNRYHKLAEKEMEGKSTYFEYTAFANQLDETIKGLQERRENVINKSIETEQELLKV